MLAQGNLRASDNKGVGPSFALSWYALRRFVWAIREEHSCLVRNHDSVLLSHCPHAVSENSVRIASVLGQTRSLLRFARGKPEPEKGPSKVSWEVINSCDARCRTCQRWTEETTPRLLSTEEGKWLIEDVARLGTLSFSFTGGEPFLREDLLELVRHASGLGLSTHISSNGLSFDDDRVREICESGLSTISFSLDGPNAELNDDLRGIDGYFETAVEYVRKLRDLREKTGRGPNIVINATISSKNASWLATFAELVRGNGADGLTFQPVHDFGGIQLGTSDNLQLKEEMVKEMSDAMEVVRKRDADIVPLPERFYSGMVDFVRDPRSLYKIPCVAGYLFAQVDPEGNIYPCPIKFASMGNIREKSFSDIWFGEEAKDIRRRIRADDHPICWMNCIAPMNILAQEIRNLRLGSLLSPSFRRHIMRRLKGA